MFPDFDHSADPPPAPIARGAYPARKRSWTPGRKHFQRVTAKTGLPLQVEFPTDTPPLTRVRLHTRLVSLSTPAIADYDLLPQPDGNWAGEAELPHAGVYELTLRYQHDKQWFTEPAPPGWVLADPQWLDSLALYTYVPTVSGTIRDWTEDLHRIRDLGFNTIQLLPVTAMDDSESPYAADQLFQLDDAYKIPGDPRRGVEQFGDWVDAVADAGLRLCLDLVFNHVGLTSEITRRRPQWIDEDLMEPDGFQRAGWHDGNVWHKWDDVVRLNYTPAAADDQAELFAYMTDYACFWSQFAARTNGLIRLDNLHRSNHGFMRQVLRTIRDRHPDLAILGELFGTGARTEELVLDYGLNLMLATPWEHKFAPQLRDYLQGLHQCAQRLRFHTPVSSHDSGSPAEEFGDNRAIHGRLLASALLGPGPWGAVQGIEFGWERQPSFIGRQARTAPPGTITYGKRIQQLNQLRRQHPAFCAADNLQFIDGQHPAILAALRLHPRSRTPLYLVTVNMDIYHEQHLDLDLAQYGIVRFGELRDLLDGACLALDTGRLCIGLEPGGARALALPPQAEGQP